MAQLYCPKCKRNQETVEVSRTTDAVTYQCVMCGKYIPVPFTSTGRGKVPAPTDVGRKR